MSTASSIAVRLNGIRSVSMGGCRPLLKPPRLCEHRATCTRSWHACPACPRFVAAEPIILDGIRAARVQVLRPPLDGLQVATPPVGPSLPELSVLVSNAIRDAVGVLRVPSGDLHAVLELLSSE